MGTDELLFLINRFSATKICGQLNYKFNSKIKENK
jgi:hypothetical protein